VSDWWGGIQGLFQGGIQQLFYATFTVALDSSSVQNGGTGPTCAPTSPELGLELSRVLLDSNVCFTLIGKVASFLPRFLQGGSNGRGADLRISLVRPVRCVAFIEGKLLRAMLISS